MPFTSNPIALTNTFERAPTRIPSRPSRTVRGGQKFQRRNTRHQGEICPLIVFMMPFAVPLWLTVRFRKWLRRRLGRRAGNVIGKAAIITFGRPPMVFPCAIFRLLGRLRKLLISSTTP
jgi:hypothetical protein